MVISLLPKSQGGPESVASGGQLAHPCTMLTNGAAAWLDSDASQGYRDQSELLLVDLMSSLPAWSFSGKGGP